ncbi:hypothetical protein OHB00_36030 [Streptomyces sp. NBC_00631]|uniref:hypothetical protein n=1 Tax=Streptomyces sp. NBC_00631 TaxID=2975793 RepID=UPI0030E1D9B5
MTAARIALTAVLCLVFFPLCPAKTAAVPSMRGAAAHLGRSAGLLARTMDSDNVTTFALDARTNKTSHVATTTAPRAAVIGFPSL